MVTRLDDARITVTLDVEGAKKDAERLEEELAEREKGRRREREDEERRKGHGKDGGGEGHLAGLVAGAAALRGGLGRLGKLVTMVGGLAALVEFLAPAVAAFLARSMENFMGEKVAGFLRDKLGFDLPGMIRKVAEEAAQKVGEGFSGLQAGVGAAADAAAFARAQTLLGAGASREQAAAFGVLMAKIRYAQETGERLQSHLDRQNIGETVADLLTGGKNP